MIFFAGAKRKINHVIQSGSFFRSLRVLSKSDVKKILLATALQAFMNILDLIGVAAIGVLGALTVRGIQSKPAGDRVGQLMILLKINDWSFQSQAAAVALFASLLLVFRTLFSMIFQRRLLYFLSRRSSELANNIISKYLNQDLVAMRKSAPQDVLYSVATGTDAITVRLIGSAINLFSDFILLILLSVGLFIASPSISIVTVLLFGVTGLILHLSMRKSAEKLSRENAFLRIRTSECFLETTNSIRELKVQNRTNYFVESLMRDRSQVAGSSAELNFLPTVSKYVIEMVVVIGTLVIGASQFLIQDAYHATANLAVFLAAGTRIAPAVLRIQQGAVQIRSSSGEGVSTLELIERLRDVPNLEPASVKSSVSYPNFEGSVKIKQMCFKLPGSKDFFFEDLELEIHKNTKVAIVGPSGAGKSTLVDIILGLLTPYSGEVSVSGLNPVDSIQRWSGAISYVPQEVFLRNGTILENIAFGYQKNEISRSRVEEVLIQAGLEEYLFDLPRGLDTEIGIRGVNLSGGQKQRLGIARALYSNPALIVLDEATSALDAKTEMLISNFLETLETRTVISIAHRLSTARKADQVIYLEQGRILARGSFEEVRSQVPDFDSNAKLLGL